MCYGDVLDDGGTTTHHENYYMQLGDELLEGGYLNTLYLDVINNPSLLLRDGGIKPYILAELNGHDLILKLTNGQSITIKDLHNTNSTAEENSLRYITSGTDVNGSCVRDILKYNEINLTRLTPENNSVDLSSSTGTQVVCATENADYTVTVGNGILNEIYIMADGNHNITTGSGYGNFVTVAKYDSNGELKEAIEGDVDVTCGNGDDTYVIVYTTGDVNVNATGDEWKDILVKEAENATITTDRADIQAFAKNQNIITTGAYCSEIETGYDDGVNKSINTITSKGEDYITIVGGQSDITLIGENKEKRIAVSPNAKTTINGVMDVKSVVFEYDNGYAGSIYNYPNFQELVFTHYKSEDTYNGDELESGYITVYGLDKIGSLIGEGIRINGTAVDGILDLDSYDDTKNKAAIDDKLTLKVYNNSDTPPYSVNHKLSGIAQYVDMSKVNNEFDADDIGMYNIGNSFIVQGSAYDDVYYYEAGTNKSVTIYEAGYYDDDELRIISDLDEFRMFFDVSVEDSEIEIGRDLIICSYGYSTAEFNDLFDSTKKDSVHALTIKDYMMTDPFVMIETVKARQGSDDYTLDRTSLIDTSNSIIQDVANWLNAHDEYSSVSQAIADSSNLSQTDLESLIGCYSGGTNYVNDYWNLA